MHWIKRFAGDAINPQLLWTGSQADGLELGFWLCATERSIGFLSAGNFIYAI